jgi:hypothetical protein
MMLQGLSHLPQGHSQSQHLRHQVEAEMGVEVHRLTMSLPHRRPQDLLQQKMFLMKLV